MPKTQKQTTEERSQLRGWKDAIAGNALEDAPEYIRQNPVLWDLYLYGYTAAKEALL